ncbi:MAG: hypothetical protein H3C34_25550 [Caldilineaceae bacterium]|nr:hypothetical protein [Caldilineaceae bacterium]
MYETVVDPKPWRLKAYWLLAFGLLVVAALAMGAYLAYRTWLTQPPAPAPTANELLALTPADVDYAAVAGSFCVAPVTGKTRVLTPEALEEEYGIRIRLVGVTAGGGLIDLRFRVVDLEKALPLLGSHVTMPVIVAEESNVSLEAPAETMHHDNLVEDRLYYMHYPNAGNAIKPGMKVALVMGDVRVESITAQ